MTAPISNVSPAYTIVRHVWETPNAHPAKSWIIENSTPVTAAARASMAIMRHPKCANYVIIVVKHAQLVPHVTLATVLLIANSQQTSVYVPKDTMMIYLMKILLLQKN